MKNEPKDKKVFYRIGEIANHLNVNTSLLRFWEKEFERFVCPERNKRGVRLYSYDDFIMFTRIHTLVKTEGMTLKGARERLINEKKAPSEREDVVHSLTKLREFLVELKKHVK